MANPRKATRPGKAKLNGPVARIEAMTTRGKYPDHTVLYRVSYKDKKVWRKLYSRGPKDGKTQWVVIAGEKVPILDTSLSWKRPLWMHPDSAKPST